MAADSDVAFTATLAERDDYIAWFVGSGGSVAADSIPMDGARSFFLQSGLPTDTLSHVWRLANRASLPNGALNFADFCIAAHLLMRIARKQIEAPPATLSPTFFAQADAFAKGKPAPPPNPFPSTAASSAGPASSLLLDDFGGSSMTTATTASSPMRPPTGASTPLGPIDTHRTGASTMSHPAIPTHRTGGSIMSSAVGSGSPIAGTPRVPPPIPVGRPSTILEMPTGTGSPVRGPSPMTGATLPRGGGGGDWGAECFDMFTKSGLPTSDLSKIWNLVSTESGGAHLRKDDFIVAMHLIFEKLAGKPIPDTLPTDLIPPPRRGGNAGTFTDHGMKSTSSTVSLASVIGGHAPSAATSSPPSGPAIPPPTTSRQLLLLPRPQPRLMTSLAAAAPPAHPLASGSARRVCRNHQRPPHRRLSSAMMANLPAAALPEAKELSDLRQNLQIRLDQARVTCDAEERILKEMKAALEAEAEAVKELKRELEDAEKKRTEMQDESRGLQEQIRRDRIEAEGLRGKLVSLNLEIAGMRQEINKLREEANRERQAKENAKGLVQMTLDAERSKKMERDVLGGGSVAVTASATARAGSVEAVGSSASRPVSTIGSLGATSPLARPGSIGSPITSGQGFGGSTNVTTSNPALATDGRAKSPAPSMGNVLPTMPLSPPPPLPGMGSPAQAPATATAPSTAADPAAAIPDDLKKQFEEDFTFDLPAPVPTQAPAATTSNADDPFAMFAGPASNAPGSGPSSAPPTAPIGGGDAFDPFGFAAPAPTSALPRHPRVSAPSDAASFDPFAAFNAPPAAAAAAAPAPASVPTSPDPFSGFDSIVPHSPPTQAAAAPAPPAASAARSPSPTSGGDPVATVMAMGFTKEQAVDALERYDFKAELAINYLFDQQNAK
ncbi:hypothetical protein BCR44DRAFT_1436066 [Catenaria anguillulae PL171]|uniref:UBA domain-containing protein n=1 Tax=Catenaria anguillulae PL171 TaxID=765915 RepID=A0A1Y2HNA3_9FUNG|nr:hypothetical protein BCR44DRAFT_1436066 [Catenaria anguillulae PL171]